MALVEGKKAWFFWDPNDEATMHSSKECMKKSNCPLPQPHIRFVAEAGSLVFIPPGWAHAVHTSQRSVGLCGSLLTMESLHNILHGWDLSLSIYWEDKLPLFKDVKEHITGIFNFSTGDLDSLLKMDSLKLDKCSKSTYSPQNVGKKRGRKLGGRKIQRPKPKVTFGKQPRGDTPCEDPEHDPSKRSSCEKRHRSYAYGFIIYPVCAACYQRNHTHRYFHVPQGYL
ncbi:hypothetical protein L7F22_063107 [Adiantum nelumboides]|nr:hypothetical protein [Adiantum nelumboides]